MKYYNEATAEMVSVTKAREGVIPVVKTITPRVACQNGYTSSMDLSIFNDTLEFEKVVKLNFIAEEDYLASNGYPVNHRVMNDPCLFMKKENGLKIIDCDSFPDAEETSVFEIGTGIHVERREDYFAYATSFVLKKPGTYDIINSQGTHRVFVSGTSLKMGNSTLASLETDKRHLVTVYKVRGVWVSYYGSHRTTMFTIVVLGDTIVGVGVNVDRADTDMVVSTYKDGMETYSATAYNFRASANMPGMLSHDEGRMWNPWWANNMNTYNHVYSKMGQVLNKVCGIINELKGGCR